jgi:hypothetical protein
MRRRWRARREAIGQVHRRERIKPSRCTSAELLFSCCDSVAVLSALANCSERRGAACNIPGTTIKDLRRTTSGAAGNGLGTTIKYLRRTTSGSAGYGLGTTIIYLRGAAGIGLGTTIRYLDHNERRRGRRPGHHDQLPARRREHGPGYPDQVTATHSECRRGKRHKYHGKSLATHNERRQE